MPKCSFQKNQEKGESTKKIHKDMRKRRFEAYETYPVSYTENNWMDSSFFARNFTLTDFNNLVLSEKTNGNTASKPPLYGHDITNRTFDLGPNSKTALSSTKLC